MVVSQTTTNLCDSTVDIGVNSRSNIFLNISSLR